MTFCEKNVFISNSSYQVTHSHTFWERLDKTVVMFSVVLLYRDTEVKIHSPQNRRVHVACVVIIWYLVQLCHHGCNLCSLEVIMKALLEVHYLNNTKKLFLDQALLSFLKLYYDVSSKWLIPWILRLQLWSLN